MKIGVGITTYNQEDYFKTLYDSLPLDKIDELVVVNGGHEYKGDYECDWIQHNKNRYPSVCRNDCITFLTNKDCDHIFILEDDIIIKDKNVFDEYIRISKNTGLTYLSFVSMSKDCGQPNNRNPAAEIHYNPDTEIVLYSHMCNEFTYHHVSSFEKTGLYDSNLRDAFDLDLVYRHSLKEHGTPFWWFPDLPDSDKYLMNNPDAKSRLQSDDREDGLSRKKMLPKTVEYFTKKHGTWINGVPKATLEHVKYRLKQIHDMK